MTFVARATIALRRATKARLLGFGQRTPSRNHRRHNAVVTALGIGSSDGSGSGPAVGADYNTANGNGKFRVIFQEQDRRIRPPPASAAVENCAVEAAPRRRWPASTATSTTLSRRIGLAPAMLGDTHRPAGAERRLEPADRPSSATPSTTTAAPGFGRTMRSTQIGAAAATRQRRVRTSSASRRRRLNGMGGVGNIAPRAAADQPGWARDGNGDQQRRHHSEFAAGLGRGR
ncbi:MAG: hypothetical protein U1E53_04780 [Dongiaceae bacterium]